jgi:hypothetical protein
MIKLDVLQPWPLSNAETSAIVAILIMCAAMVALVTLPALARLFGWQWVRHVAAFAARLAKAWPSRVRNVAPVLMLTCAPRKAKAVRGPNGRFVRADALASVIADYEGERRARAADPRKRRKARKAELL